MKRAMMTFCAPPRRGLTLLEVLVAVGLLAMLATLIAPAAFAARESAQASGCMSQLRQLGAAMRMYADDAEGRPACLADLAPRYISPSLLRCPRDPWIAKGGWAWSRFGVLEGAERKSPTAVSYAFPFTRDVLDPMWFRSEAAPGRTGYAACLLHGTAIPNSELLAGEAPHYAGKVLRLCWDGSVVIRHFPQPAFNSWELLTDDPLPYRPLSTLE